MKQVACLVVLAVVAGWLAGCRQESASPPLPEPSSTSKAPEVKAEYQRLTGRWERPDGGYVLEFRSVDASGKFDAGYFNPSAIHVERAVAYSEEGRTKVFVLLRDVNYPDCTYQLNYDPQTDQLYGQYFQASMQQTYNVTFARER